MRKLEAKITLLKTCFDLKMTRKNIFACQLSVHNKIINIRGSHSQMLFKIGVLKSFGISAGKHCVRLKPCNVIKKKL